MPLHAAILTAAAPFQACGGTSRVSYVRVSSPRSAFASRISRRTVLISTSINKRTTVWANSWGGALAETYGANSAATTPRDTAKLCNINILNTKLHFSYCARAVRALPTHTWCAQPAHMCSRRARVIASSYLVPKEPL